MLHISFNLKDAQTKIDVSQMKETPIICVIRYSDLRLRYYTGDKIHPKYWESSKSSKNYQRAKKSFIESPELNRKLDNFAVIIKNVFRSYHIENSGKEPAPEVLKQLLDIEFNRNSEVKKDFFAFFNQMIKDSESGLRMNPRTGKPMSPNTIKTYKTTQKHLLNFQKEYKRKIDFDTIDLEFYKDFKEYIMKGKKVKLKNGNEKKEDSSNNTIGKNIQILKLVLNEATERGINKNLNFKSKSFITPREKVDNIYLNEKELLEFENLNLSDTPRLERVRDLFLLGCYTGLRYSDYSVLKKENIEGGFIKINQVKTGDHVVIPIHKTVKKIIDKYNGEIPNSIANQKTNEYLKELAQKIPCMQISVHRSFTRGGYTIKQSFPKYKLVTTHTARRSFATNQYLLGVPAITIMAITGHKTERAFLKYIKLTSSEHAQLLKQYWEKESFLKVV